MAEEYTIGKNKMLWFDPKQRTTMDKIKEITGNSTSLDVRIALDKYLKELGK